MCVGRTVRLEACSATLGASAPVDAFIAGHKEPGGHPAASSDGPLPASPLDVAETRFVRVEKQQQCLLTIARAVHLPVAGQQL